MWTSSIRMQSQCLSILTFPGLQRGLALEHLSSILLICIMISCAVDNVQLDCLYCWVFFLRNEVMRNQSHGSNSMSHGLVLQRNALVFEISEPVYISGMLEKQTMTFGVVLCLQDYPQVYLSYH